MIRKIEIGFFKGTRVFVTSLIPKIMVSIFQQKSVPPWVLSTWRLRRVLQLSLRGVDKPRNKKVTYLLIRLSSRVVGTLTVDRSVPSRFLNSTQQKAYLHPFLRIPCFVFTGHFHRRSYTPGYITIHPVLHLSESSWLDKDYNPYEGKP